MGKWVRFFAPHKFAPRKFAPHKFAPHKSASHKFASRKFASRKFAPRKFAPHKSALSLTRDSSASFSVSTATKAITFDVIHDLISIIVPAPDGTGSCKQWKCKS